MTKQWKQQKFENIYTILFFSTFKNLHYIISIEENETILNQLSYGENPFLGQLTEFMHFYCGWNLVSKNFNLQ